MDFGESKPFWQCQECGFVSKTKPMPKDRSAFYAKANPPKCPKCKSEAFMPQGW